MRRVWFAALLAVWTGSGVGRGVAEAQVVTPTFMAPRAASDVGVYLSDGPGDFAVEGIWRRNLGGYDLGFRLGLADAGDVAILAGAEYRNPVALGAPLDLAVTAGAQGVFGDGGWGGIQAGLAVGYTFASPEIGITPYLHPRVGMVKIGRRGDFGLELLADIGVDVRVSQNLDLRFGAALQDFGADIGVGFAWR
jgi:hypothetical protein